MHVLIVDDQKSFRRILREVLIALQCQRISEAASLEEALRVVATESVDVALVDLRLDADDASNRDGLTLVGKIHETVVPIVVTGYSEMDEIRHAMRQGAHDYILKDKLDIHLIRPIIDDLRDRLRLEREVLRLRARCSADVLPWQLVGSSASMERLRAVVQRVAVSDRPALVLGPSGSGKEPVAHAIHAWGSNPEGPFIALNCGAIPEALVESELFGHERAAFSGADRRRDGYFASVGKGTLFLDEIAELPMPLQSKLLRVIESRSFRALGGTTECQFSGRVVAATHANLEDRVKEGRFREDLFFRLNVLPVRVPSLAERPDDIPALLAHFASQQNRVLTFSPEAIEILAQQTWPGNVRQLRTLVERLTVFTDDTVVTPASLGQIEGELPLDRNQEGRLQRLVERVLDLPLLEHDRLQAVEQALIAVAMRRANGNKSAAAELLGVHRKKVQRRS
jgi:DNA-binding NtrC family response regulator